MKLIGLISPNSSEETLADVYKILPQGIRIEARTLHVGKYTDDEFHRAELSFQGLVRDLVKQPLKFFDGDRRTLLILQRAGLGSRNS